VASQLRTQQPHRHPDVFLAVVEDGFAAVLAPASLSDGFCSRVLIDSLPALDAIGATRVGQSFARLPPHLVRAARQESVARREVSRVKVEDVDWELPSQHLEASHLRPGGVGNKEGVGTSIERRDRAEVAAPESHGVHVLELLVQYVRHHAQHVG